MQMHIYTCVEHVWPALWVIVGNDLGIYLSVRVDTGALKYDDKAGAKESELK